MIKATRKAELDRKRLEMGSAFQSDEEDRHLDEEDSEEETDSYYDSQEEGEEEPSDERMATVSDAPHSPGLRATSDLGDVMSPDLIDMQSRSALGMSPGLKEVIQNASMGMGHTASGKLRGSMSKSRRSKRSLTQEHFYFNPLRFLATFLLEKNQERKDEQNRVLQEEMQQAQ